MKIGTMLSAFLFWATITSAQSNLKVHISADMEGVVGAVTDAQMGPKGFEYQQSREFMTKEVLAAIEGARAVGATDFVIADSHGNGQNLLMKELPDDIQLVRSWPRPLGMMEGIDDSFDAAIFIGYHSSASNPKGVQAHTYTGEWTEVKLNGVAVPEAGLNAALAGHFGVPVVMISGDDAIVEEARSLLGDIEGAVVKWNYGSNAARTLMPDASYALIKEKVQKALKRLGDFQPYVTEKPVTADVRFSTSLPAEMTAYLPSVERTGSHSIRFVGEDMVAVTKFLEFLYLFDPESQL
jgi:D-amino peptidase